VDLKFNINEDYSKLLVSDMKKKLDKIYVGGGKEKIDKVHKKNKLTARERIEYLVDNDSFFEIAEFAGYGKYEEFGGCPCGGVVAGIARINKKLCLIIANDSTVKSGAWFPTTAKKNLRVQEIAIENHVPIVYLVDSAGVFLQLQDQIFPDKENFGRVFRNNAILSSKGIFQVSAIMGPCVAGGAYLPIMSDESIIVEKTGSIFLAGSHLVKAAIGEIIENEELGGAKTHCEISGITDYKAMDDKDALDKIKSIFEKINLKENKSFDRIKSEMPLHESSKIYGIIPKEIKDNYDVVEIIKCIVDKSEFLEYKKDYGKTIVCGYARVDGWSVGIVANQRKIIKSSTGEMQFGGVIYSDSANKAARFVSICNQKKIPIIFLQDVTGFMVGSKSEKGGIIKNGAKLVNAVSNSIVPKITIIIGNSYGAGNYAMCGKAYDPRFIFAWPNSKIAVMGGEQAAKVIMQLNKKAYKKDDPEYREIIENYNKSASAYNAASNLWIDKIIDPAKTREAISKSLEVSCMKEINESYSNGVMQT